MVVPAVLAGTAAPASADSGSLLVTLIDPDGTPVQGVAFGVAALDEPGKPRHEETSGHAATLPAGHYAVFMALQDGDPVLLTLATQVVTVTDGATSAITVDERQRRALTINLDPDPGPSYGVDLGARVCVDNEPVDYDSSSNVSPGRVFVIPNDDPRTQVGYLSNWSSSTSGTVYSAGGTLPLTGDPITVPVTSMGTVTVKAMKGPSSLNTDTTSLPLASQDTGCGQNVYAPAIDTALPAQHDFHATAGRWQYGYDTWKSTATVAAGSQTELDFGRAVWGPARYLPWVQKGQLGFYTSGMVADPLATGSDITINATATLYRDGKAVVTKTGLGNSQSAKGPKTFWAPITTSGAYTLKVHGYRHATGVPQPAGMMSTATDVAFSFHAGPTSNAVPPAFLTQFLPDGLDLYNRVPAGQAVSVPLRLDRTSTQAGVPMWPSTAKTVEVFGSTDGGRTWKSFTVTHTGTAWAVNLPAQSSGAELSLSARVTDTAGDQTVSTVYRAFTVA